MLCFIVLLFIQYFIVNINANVKFIVWVSHLTYGNYCHVIMSEQNEEEKEILSTSATAIKYLRVSIVI